jgi:hypothetical protein
MEAETKNHLLKNILTVINRKNACKIYGAGSAMARKGLLIFVAVRI